jgi:hypothetical protein
MISVSSHLVKIWRTFNVIRSFNIVLLQGKYEIGSTQRISPPLVEGEAVKKSHCIRLPGVNRGPDYFHSSEDTGFRLEFTPCLIRGRNDVKQHQTNFSTASGDEGERAKKDNAPSPHPSPIERLCRNSFFVTLNSFQGLVSY